MDNVIAFTPRQRLPEPETLAPLAGLALRVHLEEAAQVALDAADKIIAALDHVGGADPDETEAAPDPHRRSAMSTIVLPEATSEPMPTSQEEPKPIMAQEIRLPPAPLPWGGAGNVIAATGIAVLALVARG